MRVGRSEPEMASCDKVHFAWSKNPFGVIPVRPHFLYTVVVLLASTTRLVKRREKMKTEEMGYAVTLSRQELLDNWGRFKRRGDTEEQGQQDD
jgi:hypothetical protein